MTIDRFIRGSERLGLAPHIEEDIAFSSLKIQWDMQPCSSIIKELGQGDANQLAYERPANERRNDIILELVNGPGYYMEEPDYDWAFAVVRNYLYTQAKVIKIQSLQLSSYQPLAQ